MTIRGGAADIGVARPLTSELVLADHVERAARDPWGFVLTLLRSRSVAGRDILARLASGQRYDSARILEAARQADAAVVRDLDPLLAGQLAMVLGGQGPAPEHEAALELFGAVVGVHGIAALDHLSAQMYLQLLHRHRRRDEVMGLLDEAEIKDYSRRSLSADLANPYLYPSLGLDETVWLDRLNESLRLGAFTPLMLREGTETPFDRLDAVRGAPMHSPYRVSVVTSAYNPDSALLGAARSMIAQTWQNWEMLVVDDASPDPQARRILDEVERLDPRIRVIRKAVNGGTYRARNTAMLQMTGDFLTCVDSDDWAHPLRLETGVAPMLRDPGLMATKGYGTRISELLEVTRPGYRAVIPSASSLMIRVHPVVERIGFFDPVRKAADTEYAKRIEAAFGRPVHEVPIGALTLLRSGDDTLSASDFSFRWRHPSRWAYRQYYQMAHRRAAEGQESFFVEPDMPSRAFGVGRWRKPSDVTDPRVRHFDVVMAGDWRPYGGPQISMLHEITALRDQGLTVGVLHLEAMRFYTGQDWRLCEPLRELLYAGEVSLVHLDDDDVEIDLMLVRYPPVLQYPPAATRAVRPRRLLIVANQAPAEPDGSDQRYVPLDVHRHAEQLFGVVPQWVPQSPVIREILRPLVPADALSEWDDPAIMDVDDWYVERHGGPDRRPVVGRFSRDDAIKFPPTVDELLQAYAFGEDVEVRMLGATKTVERLFADAGLPASRVPQNWQLFRYKSVSVREFLAGLDVVLYMDHPDANEAFGRALLESAASGVLVVASPKHEATFGDALVYAEPHEAQEVVRRYLRDPELLRDQVELTLRRVRERWSREAFLGPVLRELEHVRAEREQQSDREASDGGEVLLERPGRGRVTVSQVISGSMTTVTRSLRRPADASRCDSLSVIHAGDEHAAQRALTQLTDGRRSGEWAPGSADLPRGVLAVAWSIDDRWHVRVAEGVNAFQDPDGVRVVVDEPVPV